MILCYKAFYRTLLIFGVLLILGTAGGSDIGAVSGRQETIQLVIGIVCLIGGYLLWVAKKLLKIK